MIVKRTIKRKIQWSKKVIFVEDYSISLFWKTYNTYSEDDPVDDPYRAPINGLPHLAAH